MRWPLCAYCHSMDATLAWTIVGSVAGVAAVVSGAGFGVVQVRQARAKTGVAGADGPLPNLADAYVSNVTGPVTGPADYAWRDVGWGGTTGAAFVPI